MRVHQHATNLPCIMKHERALQMGSKNNEIMEFKFPTLPTTKAPQPAATLRGTAGTCAPLDG
jgi:hypothetical protein